MILKKFEMDDLKTFKDRDNDPNLEKVMDFNLSNPDFRMVFSLKTDTDETVAIFGASMISNGVSEVWLIPAENMKNHARDVVWHLRQMTDIMVTKTDVHRVQMAVLEQNKKWAETLGFEFESLAKKYHDNLDHYIYIKVREECQPQPQE